MILEDKMMMMMITIMLMTARSAGHGGGGDGNELAGYPLIVVWNDEDGGIR